MYENIAILAVFIFIYSLISGKLERTPINGALVFAAFGLAFGPLGLDVLKMHVNAEGLRILAELTLALVLFIDASNANLSVLKKNILIPRRLLLVGLPITILIGFGLGVLLFDQLTLLEIAILATLLAPTDAALGKAVVTNKLVPAKIREGLNVESGLNDGICVPILFIFLAFAAGTGGEGSASSLALTLIAEEIGIGVAVGITLTASGVWLIKQSVINKWLTETWEQLPVVVLAVSCFAIAQILEGSGFIAAFVGGLLFGSIGKEYKKMVVADATGETMALITWVIFGATVVGQSLDLFSWEILVYSILSLTVIRMLPVFLVLSGMNLRTDEKLFIGWFGPRGLASIVFAVIVLNENLPGAGTIAITAATTIVLSVLFHGLSANPFIDKLVKRI